MTLCVAQCQALQLPAFGLQIIIVGLINLHGGESAAGLREQSVGSRIMQCSCRLLVLIVSLVIGIGCICIAGHHAEKLRPFRRHFPRVRSLNLLVAAVFDIARPFGG